MISESQRTWGWLALTLSMLVIIAVLGTYLSISMNHEVAYEYLCGPLESLVENPFGSVEALQ